MSAPISEIMARIIASIDRTEAVNLSPGQLISLLVKQVEGNQALLAYQGKFLLAQLEAPLVPGQRIRCMVEGERDGRVLLKMLPYNGLNPENASGRAIIDLLKQFGLPINEKYEHTVQALLRQELPVTRENLQAVTQLAQKTGAAVADMDILAFVFKHDIPITSKNFDLIKAAFREKDFLSTPLENLRQQVSALIRDLPADTELRRVGDKILAVIEKMTLKPGDSSGQTHVKLVDALRLLGLAGNSALAVDIEELPPVLRQLLGKITVLPQPERAGGETVAGAAMTVKNDAGQREPVATRDSAGTRETAAARDGSGLKEAITAREGAVLKDTVATRDGAAIREPVTARDGGGPKEAEAARDGAVPRDAAPPRGAMFSGERIIIREASFDADSLPALLNKLQSLIKGEAGAEKTLQTIINTVQERLGTLETLQRPAGPNNEGMLLLQSMFQAGDNKYPLEMLVKYRKEAKENSIDFSRCHVYVTLTTERLGTVQAAVQVSGRNLNCRFTAENEKARQTIEKWLPDLIPKLTQLNYNVHMLPSRIRANNPAPAIAPVIDLAGIYQVDITV